MLGNVSADGVQFTKFHVSEGDKIGSAYGLKRNDRSRNSELVRYSLTDGSAAENIHYYYGQVHFFWLRRYAGKDHTLTYLEFYKAVDQVYGFDRVSEPTKADIAVSSCFEFVNVGVIDCLVGVIKVENLWWILDRMSGKGATFDVIVRDEYVN
jgi:hypothetical protein